jgi:hypothetical protein
VRPFRARDDDELLRVVKATRPPLADEVLAELIAIAFTFPTTLSHPRGAELRKAAKKLVDKHAPPAILAALKGVSNKMHTIDARIRGLDHPLALAIARAIAFHGWYALSVPFEQDPAFRAYILDVAVDRCKRDDESELELGEIYTEWHGSHGSATSTNLVKLPATLADELAARRVRHAFTGLSFWGCELTSLPPELGRAAPWLTSLSLAYNPIEKFPEVILDLDNLESLTLLGTKLADLPSLAALRKLRHLDIGNETRMTAIPASVCALDQVRELRIGNGTIKVVPDAIKDMRALEVLDMQSAKVSKLPASLATLPALREVNIRWTKVDAEKARALLPSNVSLVT